MDRGFSYGILRYGVDVSDENGVLRRGMISSTASNGLVVDFGYPGHKSVFVPLDHCSDTVDAFQSYHFGDAVEVVCQLVADQPWRWYPGTFLTGVPGYDSFAFVAVNMGDVVVKKVVSWKAVRKISALKVSGSDILLQYVERNVDIPQSGHLGQVVPCLIQKYSEAGFMEIWIRETFTLYRKLEGGRLYYRTRAQESRIPAQIESILTKMALKYLRCAVNPAVKMRDDALDINHIMDSDKFDPIMAELPLDVMDAILSFLGPMQQVPCRKVCYLWNSLLIANANTCRVEIDITIQCYRHLACRLHTAITASTKILILSGRGDMQRCETFNNLQIVRKMLAVMNLRIRFIIISGVRVDACDVLDMYHSAPIAAKWRGICGRLILQNVAVLLDLQWFSPSPVMVRQDVLDVEVGVGLNVLEKWCPEVSGPEMDVLEWKLRLFWARTKRMSLWTIMCYCQTGDERFPPYVQGVELPIPGGIMGMPPLASLRRLTVWVLADLESKLDPGFQFSRTHG